MERPDSYPRDDAPIQLVVMVGVRDEVKTVEAWHVTGTNNVLAVHLHCEKAGVWVLTHTPSGLGVYTRFKNREEAEDFGSWLWLNVADRAGFSERDCDTAVNAAGWRVRSRLRGGGVFRQGRDNRARRIKPIESPKAEAHFRALSLELVNSLKKLKTDRTDLDKATKQHDTAVAVRDYNLDARESNLDERHIALRERENQLSHQEQLLAIATSQLNTLRTAIYESIQLVAGSANIEFVPVVRRMRNIKISVAGDTEERVI